MSMNHLTDDQLQAYLDRTTEGTGLEVASHLDICPKCRESLLHYKLLYHKLSHEETPVLATGFKAATMAKIMASPKPVPGRTFIYVWFWMLGIVSVLLAISYALNVKVLVDAMASFTQGRLIAERAVSSVFNTVLGTFGDDLPVLLFAGMLLLLVALADRILLRRKSHHGTYLWSV